MVGRYSAGLRGPGTFWPENSDHLAGGFDTDNTGGVLSGLLAEEDELDRRALWRIGSWGVGAVAAVVVAVMANQSSLGLKREQTAAADLTRQAQQIQMTARENQNETRRLASAVDTLNGDRDRLYARVTSLEQGLDSVTGAIRPASFRRRRPPGPTAVTHRADRRAGACAGRGAGRDVRPQRRARQAGGRYRAEPGDPSSVAKDAAEGSSRPKDDSQRYLRRRCCENRCRQS